MEETKEKEVNAEKTEETALQEQISVIDESVIDKLILSEQEQIITVKADDEVVESNEETSENEETSDEDYVHNPLLTSLNIILTALKYTNPIIYDKVLNTGNSAIKLFNLLEYEITPELQLISFMANYGLLAIPENILFKQGYLDKKEFDEIKKHPVISAKIAKDLYLSSFDETIEYDDETISYLNQTAEWIYKVIEEHHELPIGNPVAKGYFNKLSILRESYLIGIADKITGYTDKTRRFYGVVLPPDVAVGEVLSVFDNSTGIFLKEELNRIREFLIENL